MRDAFVKILFKIAKNDDKTVLITGDLGFGVLKPFFDNLPNQIINAGIAEQNMTSLAAGMAKENFNAITYSIGNFPTLRCLEQIRNDVCYPNLNVKIVCVGSGFSYGNLGVSHHATEDIGIMNSLPNICIFSPCDAYESETCTSLMMKHKGPCYLRLGRGGNSLVHFRHLSMRAITKPLCIKKGKNIAVFYTGDIGEEVVLAIDDKRTSDIDFAVYSCPVIKPFNKTCLIEEIKKNSFEYIITVEENNVLTGLGSIICNIVAEANLNVKVIKMGINDEFISAVGDQKYLRKLCSINSDFIVKKLNKLCKLYKK